MSNTNLGILSIVAVIMILLAVGVSRVQDSPPQISGTRYLIGSLDTTQIASIVLTGGGNTVTLNRKGKGFQVAEKGNYPAKIVEINDIIALCAEIKIGELYTDDASNHADLGVTAKDAATVVKFRQANGSTLAGVLIGITKEQGTGTYVRLVGNDDVYVTLDDTSVSTVAMDYIDAEIIGSISADDVVSVTVASGDERYTITTDKDGKVKLQEPPQGRTLKENEARNLLTAISYLRFTDVRKEDTGLDFAASFICKLDDSTVYTVDIAENNSKYYVKVKSDFLAAMPMKDTTKKESEEELKEKEAKFLARDKSLQFNAKHNGWVYEMSSYSAKNMTKGLEDLLEEIEQVDEEEVEQTDKTDESAEVGVLENLAAGEK